jgi:hypothetical protein
MDLAWAQNPHACPSNAHLSGNLGNRANYTFEFRKNCNGFWSSAIKWQFVIQDAAQANQPVICISGPTQVNVPANGIATLNCPTLPTGTNARIKITINYTVPPNNGMVHSHTVFNY